MSVPPLPSGEYLSPDGAPSPPTRKERPADAAPTGPASQGRPFDAAPPPASIPTLGSAAGSMENALAGIRRNSPEWLKRLLSDPVGRIVVAIAAIGLCGLTLLVCANLVLLGAGALPPGFRLPFGRTPTPVAAPTAYVPSESLVSSDGVEVPLAVPQTLKLPGLALPVVPVNVNQDGIWQIPLEQKATAFWVYGALVNYVFGLRDTHENQAAIDGLAKGDSIEVQMSDQRALRFQVSRKVTVPASYIELFAQTQPGLTLVLVGGPGKTRVAIAALFVGQSGAVAETGGSGPFELGAPAQTGDLRVTVTATKLVTVGASELPSGLAYFLVNFVVENTGPGPIEASLIVTELIDSAGAHYAPVIPVSAITAYPPLAGKVNPNDLRNATASYLVAASFSDAGAMWHFSPEAGSRDAVQIRLTASTASGPSTNVTLKSAALSADKSELIVSGTVVNLGSQPISVSQADLALLSGAGQVGELRKADPPLPWTLPPAAFQSYEIHFARPGTNSVIFRLLGWEFELTGVQ